MRYFIQLNDYGLLTNSHDTELVYDVRENIHMSLANRKLYKRGVYEYSYV